MKFLLIKVALVISLVLSLFVLGVKMYQDNQNLIQIPAKTTVSKTKENPKLDLKAVFKEQNQTLDSKYKAVASEIEDFQMSQKYIVKRGINATEPLQLPKEFQSACPLIKKIKKPLIKTVPKKVSRFPRVVIIMDDVRSMHQGELIRKIPLKITPSIFPSTYDHPDTPKVAKMFKHYMVHTPMEAYHFSSPEENTLNVDDSQETIDKRIKAIKKDFPGLRAINNHTGSMFTSDYDAMDRLFCVLQKYGIRFIDSRTSADSKAEIIGKIFGWHIWKRNVFLDNIDDVDAVMQRLAETVSYAKKHKVAIAICHPKDATFKALMHAKKVLRGVDVVYIDEIF